MTFSEASLLETRIAEKTPAVEAMDIIQRSMDSQAARIKHLECVIERAKNESYRHCEADDIAEILNEA